MEQGGCIAARGRFLGSCWVDGSRLSSTSRLTCHLKRMAQVSALKNGGKTIFAFYFLNTVLVLFFIRRLVEHRLMQTALPGLFLSGAHHCGYVQDDIEHDMTQSFKTEIKWLSPRLCVTPYTQALKGLKYQSILG